MGDFSLPCSFDGICSEVSAGRWTGMEESKLLQSHDDSLGKLGRLNMTLLTRIIQVISPAWQTSQRSGISHRVPKSFQSKSSNYYFSRGGRKINCDPGLNMPKLCKMITSIFFVSKLSVSK